jgi:hypothetical protein
MHPVLPLVHPGTGNRADASLITSIPDHGNGDNLRNTAYSLHVYVVLATENLTAFNPMKLSYKFHNHIYI